MSNYLPFYICKEIIDVLKKNKIVNKFYEIDKFLNIKKKIKLKKNEYILVVNYFGLSSIKKNRNNIYDFSLALFDVKNDISPSFNSLRKFIYTGYGSFLNMNKIDKKFIQQSRPKMLLKRSALQISINQKGTPSGLNFQELMSTKLPPKTRVFKPKAYKTLLF